MKNKKVCLLISTMGPGGMQKVMSVLAESFANRAHTEVHLVLYGISKELFYPLPTNVIIHTPAFSFTNSKRLYYALKTLLFVRNEVKRIQPHAILSYGEYWNSFVLIALLGLNFPLFVSDRCQPDKSLGRFHNMLRKLVYPRATGIIAQTYAAKKIYAEWFPRTDIKVIGNPIQGIKMPEVDIARENIVLTVGRLIPTKHHDLLIDLFVDINLPGWKLVIVGGDVSYQNRIELLNERIRAHGAEERIILTGNIQNVGAYYLKSKIFAFTSSSEGFPNVIGEAMSAGLPVVAFDCVAGPSDMIDNGKNGYLIPLFDKDAFASRLSELMQDEKLRTTMGQKARHDIKRFDLERIGQEYYDTLFSS